MTEALIVSNILLWVLVVALGCIVVALTRQVGLLHERVAPVGSCYQSECGCRCGPHRRGLVAGETFEGRQVVDATE